MIQAFNDVPRPSEGLDNGLVNGQQVLTDIGSMQIGYGSKVLRADESGIWLGAKTFATAPFSVDMLGNVVASTGTFAQYISKTGTGQNMTGSVNIKDNKVLIDGVNGRIVTNDGTTNRGVMGDV